MQTALEEVFRKIPGDKIGIVETGTFHGTGTTRALYEAAKATGKSGKFVTIECNPERAAEATKNLAGTGIQVWTGLTLSYDQLPTVDQIRKQFVDEADTRGGTIFYDHDPTVRAYNYLAETDFKDVPDGLFVKAILKVKPNVILLDSAGHVGWKEFQILLDTLAEDPDIFSYPLFLALDDVNHCKHAQTLEYIRNSPEWNIVSISNDRHGFAVIEYVKPKF
jgi:hypothetical protein